MSTYRLLIAHQETACPDQLTTRLHANGHHTDTIDGMSIICERAKITNPDAVIIFSHSLETPVLKQIEALEKEHPCPVIVFTSDGRSDKIHSAIHAGVDAYVVDGFSPERLEPVLETAISRFREVQTLKNELATAKADLADRKLIDRAKGMIMDQRNCKEAEAYHILRKMAMDHKKRLADVSQDILTVGEVFKS